MASHKAEEEGPAAPLLRTGHFRHPPGHLDAKQVCLLRQLSAFYTQDNIEKVLIPILTQSDHLSLRVLDWLVTNYAKKHSVVYAYTHRQGGAVTKTLLNVYSDYKCWLRNYRRKDFDPFRRRFRIWFDSRAGEKHETTVGQLNFIYWAHTYGVLEYARAHRATIEQDMNASLSQVKEQKERDLKAGHKRKRHELSRPPASRCFVYKNATTTGFDQSAV